MAILIYLFVLLYLITVSSSQTLLEDWSFMSCELRYDTGDTSATSKRKISSGFITIEEFKLCSNSNVESDGYCDCNADFFRQTLENDEDAEDHGGYFILSANGSLDYVIELQDSAENSATYEISEIRQYYVVEPDSQSTFISVQDSVDQWYNLSYQFDAESGNTFVQVDDTSDIDGVPIQSIRVHLEWKTDATDFDSSTDVVNVSRLEIYATDLTPFPTKAPTLSPSTAPSTSPSTAPTTYPSIAPTPAPTISPSRAPTGTPSESPTTASPTSAPTMSPTWKSITMMTERGDESIQKWSDNVYPLEDRGNESEYMTSSNYTLPNGRSFNPAAILAWSEIDASIELEGCDGYNLSNNNPWDESSWYYCDDGTWRLKTSGSLAAWQATYSRLEIWEIDDNGLKWLQWYFQFQWNTSTCYFNDGGEVTNCDLLPLTSSQSPSAYFEWTMPKRYADTRDAPLIAVWYDLLNIPYSIRPSLNYTYTNMTLIEEEPFTTDKWWQIITSQTFEPIIISMAVVTGGTILMFIYAAFFAPVSRAKRKEYMIDTRNLRSTFKHAPETIICPPENIVNRNRFNCNHHGPWLVIVFTARVAYMFLFSFLFLWYCFRNINQEAMNKLMQYPDFMDSVGDGMTELFYLIEGAYENETHRMLTEYEYRTEWCYDYYVNRTKERYSAGAELQTSYHNEQMDNPFGGYTFNWTLTNDSTLYVMGDGQSACSTDTSDGAVIWVSKSHSIYYEVDDLADCPTLSPTSQPTMMPTTSPTESPESDATAAPTTPSYEPTSVPSTAPTEPTYEPTAVPTPDTYSCRLDATLYSTSSSNFGEFEAITTSYCESYNRCQGWSFWDIDGNSTTEQSYVLFSSMADTPTDTSSPGACYAKSATGTEPEFLKLDSTYFANYSSNLEAQYLEEFQTYTADLYDTLQGLWSAIQDIDIEGLSETQTTASGMDVTGDWSANQNLSGAAKYGIDIGLSRWTYSITAGDQGTVQTMDYMADITIGCPDCPDGNFTEEFLQVLDEFTYNSSNLSDFSTDDIPVNVSSLVSFGSSLIEFPEFADITLPTLNFEHINLNVITSLQWTLDGILLAYRIFVTIGIMARVIRGRDVNVPLYALMVDTDYAERRCCDGRTCMDTILNLIMFCYEKVQRLSFTMWITMYWILLLTKLAIIIFAMYMLYFFLEQTVTMDTVVGLQYFDLLVTPITVQRAVRNQVLGASALQYNSYSLSQIEDQIATLAADWKDQAWSHNEDELDRVDRYNALFCDGWSAYQQTVRDVTSQSSHGEWRDYNTSSDQDALREIGTYYMYYDDDISAGIENLFDSEATTYWSPIMTDNNKTGNVILNFYLTPIWMTSDTPETDSGWNMDQITLDWRYTTDTASNDTIEFQMEIKDQSTADWTSLGINKFVPSMETTSAPQYITVSQETDTIHLRMTLMDVENWGNDLFLNSLSFAGQATDISCPKVQFVYWDFEGTLTNNPDASGTTKYVYDDDGNLVTLDDSDGTYIAECPQITPIHGLMYRGFVADDLTAQLEDGYEPYLMALREIVLSPFMIMIVMLGLLFVGYVLAFILQWLLVKLDLYRENPYARVPLVVSDWDKYDRETHETGDRGVIYRRASAGFDFVGSAQEGGRQTTRRSRMASLSEIWRRKSNPKSIEMAIAGSPISTSNGAENALAGVVQRTVSNGSSDEEDVPVETQDTGRMQSASVVF